MWKIQQKKLDEQNLLILKEILNNFEYYENIINYWKDYLKEEIWKGEFLLKI